jgi:hypothetical protein
MAEQVTRRGKRINAYKILVGKPNGNKPLGTLMHRCENSINMTYGEIMSEEDLDWINFAQNRVQWKNFVNTVIKHWSHLKVRKLLTT